MSLNFDAKVDLTFVPYFGGTSKDSNPHAAPDRKPEWLRQTVENARQFSKRVLIATCLPDDCKLADELVGEDSIFFENINPLFLPANMNRYVQSMKFDGLLLYLEADSRIRTFHTPLSTLINFVADDTDRYVVPHIWNPLLDNQICHHVTGYVMAHPETGELHGVQSIPQTVIHRDTMVAHDQPTMYRVPDELGWQSIVESFGGAFLCHSELFNLVNFQDAYPDPLEHAGGIDIFKLGKCFKTRRLDDFIRENLGDNPAHIRNCGPLPINPNQVLQF